jgi:ABC-2 type transport system permease protein
MHKALTFARREYIASVKTKGFIIGLILAPLMMTGSLIAFVLLKDRVDTTDKTVAIVDRTGRVAVAVIAAANDRNAEDLLERRTGKKIQPAYFFHEAPPSPDSAAQRFEFSEKVRRGELHAFLEIGPGAVHPGANAEANRVAYYAKNPALDDVRRWLTGPLNDRLRILRLQDAGIDASRVKDLFVWSGVEGMGLITMDEESGDLSKAKRASEVEAILVPILTMVLMFMMIMMTVPGMVQSVMEEKTQRIAEVLLGSITPFDFMLGKLLGGIGVALTSSAIYLLGAILVLTYVGLEGYIPYRALAWFPPYLLAAIVMFGAMAAALGSTCSEPKDAQSLTFPTILPAMIPMFVYFPVTREPAGPMATWLSLFPPFTPTLMVLRLATPEAIPVWQPIAGFAGVLLVTVLSVWAAGRIFRVAILMQGTPPKLGNIVRWAIRG